MAVDLDSSIYAIDSTTVDLCLSIFPWAKFRRKKGAIKIHTQLELRGSIPVLIHVTDGKTHDVNWLDCLVYEAGSFYVFDRGYVDFSRLYYIHKCRAFFVTRSKTNMRYYVCFSQGIEENSGVICDQIIRLTNTFDLSALNVAKLYKLRWQVELFFKWIKQNLRIKAFFGRDQNAVRTQIWAAIAVYALLLIIRKHIGENLSMHTILTVFSVNIFEKVPLQELFMGIPA